MFVFTPKVNITAKASLRALSISVIQSEPVTIVASFQKHSGVQVTPLQEL